MVINMNLGESSDFMEKENDFTKYLVYRKFIKIFEFQKTLEVE